MKKDERDIEKWLTKRIRILGGKSYKWTSPGNVGVPDRIYILPKGLVCFAELKTDTGQLSEAQKYQIRQLRERGAWVEVVRGMEEAKELIRKMEGRLAE